VRLHASGRGSPTIFILHVVLWMPIFRAWR